MHVGKSITGFLTGITSTGGKSKSEKSDAKDKALKEASSKEVSKPPEEPKKVESKQVEITKTQGQEPTSRLPRQNSRSQLMFKRVSQAAGLSSLVSTTSSKIQPHIAIIKKEGATESEINKAISDIKDIAVSSLSKNATQEEKNNAIAKQLVGVLREIGTPNKSPEANRLVSYELGKAILKPNSFDGENAFAMHEIEYKGMEKPGSCGSDMWRSIPIMTISKNNTPKFEGKKIDEDDGVANGEQVSGMMKNTLNLFYQHVTGTTDNLILNEFGGTQGDGEAVGNGLPEQLTDMEEKQAITMKRMFGLAGSQEMIHQFAGQTMSIELKDNMGAKGTNGIVISEFNRAHEAKMTPLQFEREISINLTNDGVDFTVGQPIVFKDMASKEPLGTCRLQTTLSFDNEMNCRSQKQEIKAAEIIRSET